MTLREKLELAGYRLRALALHMPTEWQKKEGLAWADDAISASAGEAGTATTVQQGVVHEHAAPEGGDAQ